MGTLDRLLRNLPDYYLPGAITDAALPAQSPLGAILGAIAQGIDTVTAQQALARQVFGVVGATGSWVDFLASLYGIPPRFANETDGQLIRRILYALTPGTVANLQAMLQPYSSVTPIVFEPMGGLMHGRTFADWQQSQTTLAGTFSRATVAYDPANGQQVASGVPVYEAGKYGGALLMWGAVTNLLTANQSSWESGIAGATAVNAATLAQSSAEAWSGTYSLAVTTPGAVVGEGVYVGITSSTASDPYAGSVYLLGAGTVECYVYDATNNLTGPAQTLTLNGGWQRLSNVDLTLGATASTDLRLYVVTSGTAQAVTFYADGVQLEQAGFSGVWQIGGTPRDADALTLATSAYLSAAQGTIQGWYLGGQDWQAVAASAGLWESNPGQSGSLQLQAAATGLSWGASGGSAATFAYPASGYTLGWHFLTATWQAGASGTTLTLIVDGAQVAQATSAVAPTFAATLAYGACAGHQANGLLEDWRLLDFARSLAGAQSDYGMSGPLQPTAGTLGLFSFNDSTSATIGGDYEGVAFYVRVGFLAIGGSSSSQAFLDQSYLDQSYLTSGSAPNPGASDVAAILAQKMPAGVRVLITNGGV